MKKLVLLCCIIFLSVNLVYSRGSSEISQIDNAKALVEEKRYNDAIALLTNYVSENPNAIYEVQSLIDDIRDERDKNNTLMDDIIKALYDDEDFEEGARLIKEYESNNPFPDELSKIFINDARDAATFVINQKSFVTFMDQALALLETGQYNEALDKYLLCMDFHLDEFDLLIDSSSESEVKEVSLEITSIDENTPLNSYYSTLKNSSFREVDELKNRTETLKSYITEIQSAYSNSLKIIEGDSINLTDLENSLSIFKEIPSRINELNNNKDQLIDYNELFSRISLNGSKSKFMSYASITLTGRKEREEGILYTIDQMFPIYINDLISRLEEKAINELEQAVLLYELGELESANPMFTKSINSFNALDKTASTWKVFVKVDKNFNIIGGDILQKYYRFVADAGVALEVIESYNQLSNYKNSLTISEVEDSTERYRSFLVSLNDELIIDRNYWKSIKTDVNSRTVMRYNHASEWINTLENEFKILEDNLVVREIKLLDEISKTNYVNIFGFDVDSVDVDSDAMGELISKASIPTNEPEIINVYFDINNTDERTLTTYNPKKSLENLEQIEGDYSLFIENLENYVDKFQNEKAYIFDDVNFSSRFDSIVGALSLANTNKTFLTNYKVEAEEKITLSTESENRGTTIYQNALIAVDNENFTEARALIETGKSVSEVSLNYSNNSYVINQLIPNLYNLWDVISKEEARIVIRDVRKLITEGKTQYLEGAYIPASNLFRDAELKWAETNSDSHPEIPYWLALIRDALDIESGRYLTITEPLYNILAGYLSFAENYYRTGLKEENKVNKLKDFAIADSYIVKVLEVKPLNERARFLQLQVLKSKDPEAFKVIFNNDFLRYRNNVIRGIDNNATLASESIIPTLSTYENIVRDAYLLNPRLSGSYKRSLLERFYTPVSTFGKSLTQINNEKSDIEEKRKTINESYIRFQDLYKIAEDEQKEIVKRLMNISEVALGFRRLPVDTSNIRESNAIFVQAQNRLDETNQTEIDELNDIMIDLQRALTLNPQNDDIPVVIDDILVMLGEESNFQLAPAEDKIFREAQKDFIDGRYYDAKDKIIEVLQANSKNKNYPKLKELINRVEIKIKEEIII